MSTPAIGSLKGTGYRSVQVPTMNRGQSDLLNQLLGSLQPGLSNGLSSLGKMAAGDQGQFEAMEAPALRQHNQLLGGLASRFSGFGSGARNSSGFQNAASEATTDLAERLAANRMSFQRDAIEQLLGLSQNLLGQRSFETGFIPKKESLWRSLLGSGASGFGSALGSFPRLFI